jgi:chemotaxis protein CheC
VAPGHDLTELEHDALTELVNIGVSRAATSLRDMVQEQVLLSVPSVSVVTRDEAVRRLAVDHGRLIAVHQLFEGDIAGRAMLIFPEARSLELVRAVTGGDLPIEDIIELEQEALAETGNIILNGCLATIANMLERTLKMSLPEILWGESSDLFNIGPRLQDDDVVMFLYINFLIKTRDIQGYIALLMDLPSLNNLKVLLRHLIARTTGEPEALPDVQA